MQDIILDIFKGAEVILEIRQVRTEVVSTSGGKIITADRYLLSNGWICQVNDDYHSERERQVAAHNRTIKMETPGQVHSLSVTKMAFYADIVRR